MEYISQTGHTLMTLPVYPILEIAHYVLSALAVRNDILKLHPQRENEPSFVQQHPLSCWFSVLLTCFAGAMFQSIILGQPPIQCLAATDRVFAVTIVWYVVFCSPMDVAVKLLTFGPVQWVMHVLAEVRRTHMVYDGVLKAGAIYPSGYTIMLINGVARGAGGGLVRIFERMMRGVWVPTQNEFHTPSTTFKVVVLASLTCVLQRAGVISPTPAVLFFAVTLLFIYFRFTALFLGINNPFMPFENLLSSILLGGVLSAYQRVKTQSAATSNGTAADRRRSLRSEKSVDLQDKKKQ